MATASPVSACCPYLTLAYVPCTVERHGLLYASSNCQSIASRDSGGRTAPALAASLAATTAPTHLANGAPHIVLAHPLAEIERAGALQHLRTAHCKEGRRGPQAAAAAAPYPGGPAARPPLWRCSATIVLTFLLKVCT